MEKRQTREREVGVRSSLRSLCCVLEQDTLQFHGHHSYFRKDFQILLTLKEGHT